MICSRLILSTSINDDSDDPMTALTPKIVRLNDAEFVGTIGFVGFVTDHRRSDDEGSETIQVGFVSLSIQLKTENGYFSYNGWRTTDVLPVGLLINSSVGGGTSIEAPSMEDWEKGRRR